MSLEVAAKLKLGSFILDAAFRSEGRITGVVGRSGSGKTTVVNVIAGLLQPEQGKVIAGDTPLFDSASGVDVPAYRRRMGYVFQEARLFPHLSVRHNLLYGHWFAPRGVPGASFPEVVELLGLESLLERATSKLSGGEKQRVAIGRALLSSPRLLLMDEPLASLDEARKAELMPYLERLRDRARVPIVYVSHSVPEVVRLAGSVVVMADGKVLAVGPTREVMGRVDLAPLTGLADAGAVIEGTVAEQNEATGLTTLTSRAGSFRVPRLELGIGSRVRMRIRARDVIVAVERPRGLSALNVLAGSIAEIGTSQGPIVDIAVDCGGERLLARLTRHSVESLQLAPGRPVYALVKSITFDQVSGLDSLVADA